MTKDLRKARHLFDGASALAFGICELTWQGDFGKGVSTGSGVWSDPGANPCVLYAVPSTTSPTSGLGVPAPQFRVGMVVTGDLGTEFVYGKLVLAAIADVLPGQAYEFDENYNATLLTTANSVLNAELVVLNVWYPQAPIGTYYGWFQRAGRAAVQAAAASITNAQAETTATAGQLKFLASAGHTAGTKSTQSATSMGASSSIQFTGATTNGSPYITNVASTNALGGITDLQVGQVITGANLPANSMIAAIDKMGPGNGWRITIGTNTAGSYSTLQNATASAAGTTFTVTNMVVVNLCWATLQTQN